VIERHDGHVWAHAVVDEGTTVRFTLASGRS
jgi:signal transduction histidine kinase